MKRGSNICEENVISLWVSKGRRRPMRKRGNKKRPSVSKGRKSKEVRGSWPRKRGNTKSLKKLWGDRLLIYSEVKRDSPQVVSRGEGGRSHCYRKKGGKWWGNGKQGMKGKGDATTEKKKVKQHPLKMVRWRPGSTDPMQVVFRMRGVSGKGKSKRAIQ